MCVKKKWKKTSCVREDIIEKARDTLLHGSCGCSKKKVKILFFFPLMMMEALDSPSGRIESTERDRQQMFHRIKRNCWPCQVYTTKWNGNSSRTDDVGNQHLDAIKLLMIREKVSDAYGDFWWETYGLLFSHGQLWFRFDLEIAAAPAGIRSAQEVSRKRKWLGTTTR